MILFIMSLFVVTLYTRDRSRWLSMAKLPTAIIFYFSQSLDLCAAHSLGLVLLFLLLSFRSYTRPRGVVSCSYSPPPVIHYSRLVRDNDFANNRLPPPPSLSKFRVVRIKKTKKYMWRVYKTMMVVTDFSRIPMLHWRIVVDRHIRCTYIWIWKYIYIYTIMHVHLTAMKCWIWRYNIRTPYTYRHYMMSKMSKLLYL